MWTTQPRLQGAVGEPHHGDCPLQVISTLSLTQDLENWSLQAKMQQGAGGKIPGTGLVQRGAAPTLVPRRGSVGQDLCCSFADLNSSLQVVTLLSQLGNQWSLWFGSSVLSVVELVELILDFVVLTGILAVHRLYFHQFKAPELSSHDDTAFSSASPPSSTPPRGSARAAIASLPSYNSLESFGPPRAPDRETEQGPCPNGLLMS